MSEDGDFAGRRARVARPATAREMPVTPWPGRPGSVGGDMPDTNVWLALAVQEHPHHEAARAYWAETQAARRSAPANETSLWFCRSTMLGFVRLLCQPGVVGAGALPPSQSLALYQRFRNLPSVGLLPEPPESEAALATFVTARNVQPRQWGDAWLAAQASSAGVRLVTFDRDFLRFGLERCLVLPAQ